MVVDILVAAMMQTTIGGTIIASLRQQAEAYQPRVSCSVTVATDVDTESGKGRRTKNGVVRFDHRTGAWETMAGDTGGEDDPAPRDWYGRALTVAAAAEEAVRQEDGTFLLSTESLPKGIVANAGRDLGSRSQATAIVSTNSGDPAVMQYTISLKEPFRIPLIARGRDYQEEMVFEETDDYGPLTTRRVRVWDVSFPGGFSRGRSVFTYSDYDCTNSVGISQ
ncbi:MAG: hypothetical protein AAGI89_03625 [Pseudomonadota bacterium]